MKTFIVEAKHIMRMISVIILEVEMAIFWFVYINIVIQHGHNYSHIPIANDKICSYIMY